MAELNTRHQHRWLAAQRLVVRLLKTAVFENATLMFEGQMLPFEAIVVNERGIYVDTDPNCRYIMFEADPEMDHGLYDKTKDFEACFRKRFTLVKKVAY
jgi:hypothetical protein